MDFLLGKVTHLNEVEDTEETFLDDGVPLCSCSDAAITMTENSRDFWL